ncbi:hypothetical protein AAFC00_007135 [Neodothiora populina]|uniref:TPR-like protein n=1 Tax=Neodothiora populina TaxID=2781224 RepID=A0ABR3PHM6_9PEZI
MTTRVPLHLSRRLSALDTCVSCTHRCSYVGAQKRFARVAARKAPSTRDKAWQSQPRVITPEVKAGKAHTEEILKSLADSAEDLSLESKVWIFQGNTELVMRLSNPMAYFVMVFEASPKTQEDFNRQLKVNGVSVDEIYHATFILRNLGTPAQAKLGRYLIRCCDRAGHAEATIQTVASHLRQDLVNPGVLRYRESLQSQERLRDLCQAGNLRAMVLSGKLAERKGDPDQAITLYQNAVDMYLNAAPGERVINILDEFSSPWMELGILHLRRNNRRKAIEAYMVGIDQGDPMAHNMLANLDFTFTGGEYTMDWLYNMTKAAATGHHRAAYNLGEYYANTPAPPAPDSFASSSPNPTLLSRIHHFVTTALFQPSITEDHSADITHYASAISTPLSRYLASLAWLTLSSKLHYLPAHLHLARLHLRTHILDSNNLWTDLSTPSATKNPAYDPSLAHDSLLAVFKAHKVVTQARQQATREAEFRAMVGPLKDLLEEYEEGLDEMLEEARELADGAGLDVDGGAMWGVLYKHQGERAMEGYWD